MAVCRSVPVIHIFAVLLGSLEIMLFGGVVFGWHSLVYVYKDTGYFSSVCPGGTQLSPVSNITTQVHPITNDSHTYNVTSTDGADWSTASPGISNRTNTPLYRTSASSSIYFEELSCEEQMKVHEENRVSAVCKAQDEQFNLVFSLSTGINGMLSFPSGFLYDRLGTRISRIISIVSFLVGQVCLITASPSNPYLLYPGFIGLVYGGYQILLTNLQLSCLIPALRSTIMSLYSGSYDTSASMFLLFKAAYEGGVSVNASFTLQAVLYFLIFTSSTFLLLPKSRIPFPLTQGYRLRCYLCHRLCGHRSLSEQATHPSSEWRIDPTGSVILAKFASRDSLDAPPGVAGIPPDLKTDLNGTVPGNLEVEDSHSAGDSLKEKKVVTEEDENKPQNGDDVVFSSNDNADGMSPLDMEMEISPVSDDSTLPQDDAHAANDKETSQRSPPEVESMLSGAAKKESKTFRQVALSPLFLTDVMWISVQRLRSWIFVGMFNPWITRLACGDKALISHYTSVYAALQFFGILTAPLSGRLMDRKIKGAEKYGNPRHERLHAAIASFVLNSTVSVLLTVCSMIPVLKLQYLTFILHCLHRSFLYGPNSAFVVNAFPNEHFGKLFGVTLTVSALFSMLQYPLFLIMQGPLGGDPLAINIFLLVLMLISFIHPAYIWRYLQKKLAQRSTS